MNGFRNWIDIPFIVCFYLVALGSFLYWIHRSSQQSVEKTLETNQRLIFRLGLVVTAIGFLCYLVGIPSWIVLPTIVVVTVLGPSGDLMGLVFLPFFALGHLIKEYVLGFPELLLEPPKAHPTASETNEKLVALIGSKGVATAPLRPSGEVVIEEQTYAAASANGQMISMETSVQVTGVRGATLLVSEQVHDPASSSSSD